ncbi:hypothetical protein JKP88DRAFT_321710 [Tribonema minus]|uniref:Smr domain-containing protein n=1 Tax=Tribonema minus TaxID=303371 RepID=A0A835YUL6_9STRA|nr:hypothetical protein JKP88DRAFT_321710 [Tribonema minus]
MAARGQVADASVPPGAEAAPETAKYNDAIKKYASGGEWAKAVVLIDKMREINLSPSIEAYGDTITALRRGLEFDRADALLADMYDACMPADLFAKYAAADPSDASSTQTQCVFALENDGSSTQTQRVFALLLCMRTDQLEPDVDTYRAVMGMCTKDRLWHLSLLLLEHMRLRGVQPGKFIYNEICTVLDMEGKHDLAEIVYERSLGEGVFEPWIEDDNKVDLHSFTLNTARAAVRSALTDMLRQPSGRPFHDPAAPMHIITGVGRRSEEGVAVIKPAILDMLNVELQIPAEPAILDMLNVELQIPAEVQKHNPGCVEIQPQHLQAWARARLAAVGATTDPRLMALALRLEPQEPPQADAPAAAAAPAKRGRKPRAKAAAPPAPE